MLRPFCEIGHFAKWLAIMQKDLNSGNFAKLPEIPYILQNGQDFGQFTK